MNKNHIKTVLNVYLIIVLVSSQQLILRAQSFYSIHPVPIKNVELTDNFWLPRLEKAKDITVPHSFNECRLTGRIDNFAIAAGIKQGEQSGRYPFDDSDVYKTIEGASYLLMSYNDPKLEKYVDSLITLIAEAQEPDGYIYTARTNNAKKLYLRFGDKRWSRLDMSHELYDAGHLFEAAVAHYQATGKKNFLNVAIKLADLLTRTFGLSGLHNPPGHQEVEIGLIKLYDVTGNKKYFNLAKFFIDERGHADNSRKLYGEYAQDNIPVLEQDEAVGHAVREGYMCAAVTDIAAITGDKNYARASERIWENVVGKKMYLTGGLGATGFIEGFSKNYDLPNLSAYAETCASIANVFWNQRLFLLTGESKYIDVLEQTLYNALLSGISLGGDDFFYPNPLTSKGFQERTPWFTCACCPTNLSRFIPSLPGYIYQTKDDTLYVNLYVGSETKIKMGNEEVKLTQETNYPWEGKVKFTIDGTDKNDFTLRLRIPCWAKGNPVPSDLCKFMNPKIEPVIITVNGEMVKYNMSKGYAEIAREWNTGDVVEMNLPMPVQRIVANDKVEADKGLVAIQRGPIVYCLEWVDNNGHVLNSVLTDTSQFYYQYEKNLLDGIDVIEANGYSTRYDRETGKNLITDKQLIAIPYYSWANRGIGEMTVWIPREESFSLPIDGPSLASQSKISSSGGTGINVLYKELNPESSHDASQGKFVFDSGTDTVWVQYDLPKMEEVSEVKVYWYENENCRVPKSWKVLSLYNGKWEQVYTPQGIWPTKIDNFNDVIFETVRTNSIRLIVVKQEQTNCGILSFKIE